MDTDCPLSVSASRLSSIIEEDSMVMTPNEEEEAKSNNPLQEALEAITTLAQLGDFEDDDDVDEKADLGDGDDGHLPKSVPPLKPDRQVRPSLKMLRSISDENKENESDNEAVPKKPNDLIKTEAPKVITEDEDSDDDEDRLEVVEEPCVERIYPMLGDKKKSSSSNKVEEPLKKPNPLEEAPLGTNNLGSYNFEKILEPSANATAQGILLPCPTCQRTFLQAALERHIKICQKVGTKKRNESVTKSQTNSNLNGSTTPQLTRKLSMEKKKPVKPEDEFKKCPHCDRTFGPKPYDRHVKWCAEKSRRLMDSPNKDLVALAKLHARTGYRPKTPGKKEDDSPSRKTSSIFGDSPLPSIAGDFSRSESRNSRRSSERRMSRPEDISSRNSKDHLIETPETQFIRAATGRGSIKKGPAPTKASQLRQLAKDQELKKKSASDANAPVYAPSPSNSTSVYGSFNRSTPVQSRRSVMSPASLTSNKRTTPTRSMSQSYHAGTNGTIYSFQPVVKPVVVKPTSHAPPPQPSTTYRREPEGIEHEPSVRGSYDHSAEYDPYQLAAKQMQELLFGSAPGPTPKPSSATSAKSNDNYNTTANLRPSSNSAFEKYVPSTVDINTKLNAKTSFVDPINPYLTTQPRRSDHLKGTSGLWSSPDSYGDAPRIVNFNPKPSVLTNGNISNRSKSPNPKVARFCHECGNPFALPSIKFCCECGVRRLYC